MSTFLTAHIQLLQDEVSDLKEKMSQNPVYKKPQPAVFVNQHERLKYVTHKATLNADDEQLQDKLAELREITSYQKKVKPLRNFTHIDSENPRLEPHDTWRFDTIVQNGHVKTIEQLQHVQNQLFAEQFVLDYVAVMLNGSEYDVFVTLNTALLQYLKKADLKCAEEQTYVTQLFKIRFAELSNGVHVDIRKLLTPEKLKELVKRQLQNCSCFSLFQEYNRQALSEWSVEQFFQFFETGKPWLLWQPELYYYTKDKRQKIIHIINPDILPETDREELKHCRMFGKLRDTSLGESNQHLLTRLKHWKKHQMTHRQMQRNLVFFPPQTRPAHDDQMVFDSADTTFLLRDMYMALTDDKFEVVSDGHYVFDSTD